MGGVEYGAPEMTDDASERRAWLRVKRKNYFVCALFFVVGVVFYGLLEPAPSALLVGVQLLCSASFAVLGLCVGREWVTEEQAGLGSVVLGVVAATFLVHASGGPASPYFQVYGSLPCLIAMFTPDNRGPALLGSALTLSAVALLDTLAGVPVRTMCCSSRASPCSAACPCLAPAVDVCGSRSARRSRRGSRRWSSSRRVSAAGCSPTASGREVDRLVLVGQLATGVAPEVNNPLAFVKSNLNYLEREVRATHPMPHREELWTCSPRRARGCCASSSS